MYKLKELSLGLIALLKIIKKKVGYCKIKEILFSDFQNQQERIYGIVPDFMHSKMLSDQ